MLSSEFIHNVLRILSFVNFNVLNICSVVKLNFENILGFRLPFIHVSSQILFIELRFRVKKSFVFLLNWKPSFSVVLILSKSVSKISWGLLLVLFTLSYLVSYWNFWTKWSLETVVGCISWIDIICTLSHTDWRY